MRPGGRVTVRAPARRAWGWHTLAPGVGYACEGTASPHHGSDPALRYQRRNDFCLALRWRLRLMSARPHARARSAHQVRAAMAAVAGMVMIQAHTTRPATPQRTALSRFSEPTPTMAPVMVCVVLTGTPRKIVRISVVAAPVSAQKPSTGLS